MSNLVGASIVSDLVGIIAIALVLCLTLWVQLLYEFQQRRWNRELKIINAQFNALEKKLDDADGRLNTLGSRLTALEYIAATQKKPVKKAKKDKKQVEK